MMFSSLLQLSAKHAQMTDLTGLRSSGDAATGSTLSFPEPNVAFWWFIDVTIGFNTDSNVGGVSSMPTSLVFRFSEYPVRSSWSLQTFISDSRSNDDKSAPKLMKFFIYLSS